MCCVLRGQYGANESYPKTSPYSKLPKWVFIGTARSTQKSTAGAGAEIKRPWLLLLRCAYLNTRTACLLPSQSRCFYANSSGAWRRPLSTGSSKKQPAIQMADGGIALGARSWNTNRRPEKKTRQRQRPEAGCWEMMGVPFMFTPRHMALVRRGGEQPPAM